MHEEGKEERGVTKEKGLKASDSQQVVRTGSGLKKNGGGVSAFA